MREKRLEAVVAVYSDWGIGAEGTQPVTVNADRKHFKELTEGAAVIVGRKTLADFPGGRPLKNRVNIVLTRRETKIDGAIAVHSAAEALTEAAKHDRALVIGGESVYRELLPHIDRIYITKLNCAPHSDVYFPNLDADPAWHVAEAGEEGQEDGITYRFLTYERE